MGERDNREVPVDKLLEAFSLLERRVDSQERMLAEMFTAYQELWAAIEAIIKTVIEPLDEKEREAFTKIMGQYRAQLLQAIKDHASDLAERLDKSAGAMEDVAPDEHATPNTQ
ncbi:MAG TPA: hypothetical protein VJ742_13205 [Nitrososphaera sp.]|nr:hypothetical protein [Nitrososphaera sp.]